MLPSEDALWVGQELTRVRAPSLAVRLTATDANRFGDPAGARADGAPKILVFNWCYQGTVDETFASLEERLGRLAAGERRPAVALAETTRVSSGTTRRDSSVSFGTATSRACLPNRR
jgi:glutamate-1-semialdehyde 2,1-aminomutase